MKKSLLFVSVLAASILYAQDNDKLKKKLQQQNKELSEKFDSYVAKKSSSARELTIDIEEKKSSLAGFDPSGRPYFYKENDLVQVKNSNADFLQNGTVNGLAGSFNGEGIRYTVFDGGRAYAAHVVFNNLPNRVTNREASTMNYSAHGTGVTSFIGAKNYPYTVTFQNGTTQNVNFKGIAPNSTFDNYSFETTTLPGATTTSTTFQKILIAQPKISNHSYGTSMGWDLASANGANVWVWRGNFTSPNTSYDLQGTYYTDDRDYDQIVYNNPSYVIVKAAGNSYGQGPAYPGTAAFAKYYYNAAGNPTLFTATDVLPQSNCGLGADCIGPGSLAKNLIIVGATNIITTNNNTYVTATDVVHSDYSSAGPRDDGGIKPDITTTGTEVFHASTAEDTTGSQSVGGGSGTSYSAPVVTGIIGLWMQIYRQLFPALELNAAAAKTLMVHSALEAGNDGPDPWFGWGYINAKKGAELLVGKSNNTIIFNDEVLTSGTANIKRIKALGTESLKVTISWIDPAYSLPANLTWPQIHNDRTSKLVNDLDLRIIDTTNNTVYSPWKLNPDNPMVPASKGDNIVDNVEQVVFNTPVAGREYRIEITNKGNLINSAGTAAPQNYSVLVSGFSEELLATGEVAKPSGIVIVPTITKDFVRILKAPSKSTYSIYDLSGKLVQSGSVNSDDISLDFSSLAKGIYIVEVKTEKEIITKKVIKE